MGEKTPTQIKKTNKTREESNKNNKTKRQGGREATHQKNNKPNLKQTSRFGVCGVAYQGSSCGKLPLFRTVLKCLLSSINLYKWCLTEEWAEKDVDV